MTTATLRRRWLCVECGTTGEASTEPLAIKDLEAHWVSHHPALIPGWDTDNKKESVA